MALGQTAWSGTFNRRKNPPRLDKYRSDSNTRPMGAQVRPMLRIPSKRTWSESPRRKALSGRPDEYWRTMVLKTQLMLDACLQSAASQGRMVDWLRHGLVVFQSLALLLDGRGGDELTFSDLPHVRDIAKMNVSPSQPRNRKSTD